MDSNKKKMKDGQKSLERFKDDLRRIRENKSKKSLSKSIVRKEIWHPSRAEEIILDK